MLNALLHSFWARLLAVTFISLPVCEFNCFAQVKASSVTYKSETDDLITIQSVSSLPFTDNLQGIYARPLENHLLEKLGSMHRWDVLPLNFVGPILSPEDLESDLSQAQKLASGISSDAFFACRISKGPNGVSINLSLFLKRDGKLIAQATLKDSKRFDLKELKEQVDSLLAKIVAQIPYQGRILSRDGNRVTVNVGRRDGIQNGQVISVVQIIGLTRHPKFNFIISSEKEIIGRVKILKVDDTLSFGVVTSERDRDVIQKGAKVSGLDFVAYPDTNSLEPVTEQDLSEKRDNQLSFGDNPSAWVPKRPPSFGQVGARLGIGQYKGSLNIPSVANLDTADSLVPSVFLEGEIWVTTDFSVHAAFRQAIAPVDQPRSGASPAEVNQSITSYELMFGYNFRMGPNIWGTNIELLLGYMTHKVFADSSTPESVTTMEYNGFKTGAKGSFPVTADMKWSAGGQAFLVLFPRLNETPITSGANSSNAINIFGIFGGYRLGENLRLQANIDFELYSTNFSGDGTRTEDATSASQRITTLSGGIYYLF